MIIQRRILNLLDRLRSDLDISIIMITHDISAAVALCDRIAVMYGGRAVEVSDTHTILNDPRHPYTLGLRNAFPSVFDTSEELVSIPGEPFHPIEPSDQCRFVERCPFAVEECSEKTPQVNMYGSNHAVECIRADEKELLQTKAGQTETWNQTNINLNQQPISDDSFTASGGDD